jgi:hypothetical protein
LDAAEVSITDVLVTLVYMRRSKAHLAIETEEWALHRVFLGALVLAHKVSQMRFHLTIESTMLIFVLQYSNDSSLRNASWSCATGVFGMRDIGRMEREFLDVMDYELSVSEADLLDLHETLVPSRSSQQSTQLHPFFHISPLELAPRPQGGVEMFRARRIVDDDEEDEEEETESTSSGYLYMDDLPTTPVFDDMDASDQETRVETDSSPTSSSSADSPTSSEFSSEPSTSATSVFSHHLSMVSKPAWEEEDDSQISALSRALLLAGHHLVSSLPTAFPQIAVSS